MTLRLVVSVFNAKDSVVTTSPSRSLFDVYTSMVVRGDDAEGVPDLVPSLSISFNMLWLNVRVAASQVYNSINDCYNHPSPTKLTLAIFLHYILRAMTPAPIIIRLHLYFKVTMHGDSIL